MSALLWVLLIVVAVAVVAVAVFLARKSRRAGSVLAARVSNPGSG